MSFVPACIITCSSDFHKLGFAWSKISIEDAPGYFRIFTLMFSSLFILSYPFSIPFNIDFLWFRYVTFFSGLALLIWLFDFSFLWLFDFTDVLFSLIAATCSFIAFILLFLYECSYRFYIGLAGCKFGWNLIY